MIAYHVDRWNTLKPGQEITYLRPSVNPPFLSDTIYTLYPEGVSMHGKKIFVDAPSEDIAKDIIIENTFEYERRLNFPYQPSRFQSLFASETIEESAKWLFKLNSRKTPVMWMIEFDHPNYVKLDAAWLYLNINKPSFLMVMHDASCYWKGIAHHENPEYELLIKPPIRVLHRII